MQLIQANPHDKLTPARQRHLALLITALLLLVALWWLAQLTWRVLTPADTVVTAPAQTAQRSRATTIDVSALQALNIFGDRAAEATSINQAAIDAPETTLNVRLVGLVASDRPELSAAIIEQGGSQQTYIIGERIANSRASVEQIFPDRVLLDNGGRREVLYIEGLDAAEAQLRTRPANAVTPSGPGPSMQRVQVEVPNNQDVAQAVAGVRDDPSTILEIINISPLREGQRVIGYRLLPRESTELFAALGFQAGDVAVAINGFDLTDAGQALAAVNELEDATRAIIQVRRNNELVDLEIQIP